MALDGIFLYSTINELKNNLLNGKVEKVNQPEKDEIILSIKNNRHLFKLLISSSPVYPRVHITKSTKENPLTPPMFCMLLRKYLQGAKLVDIRQLYTDRVVFLDFENKNELGFDNVYTLVIEIMGRHSNITLIRKNDNIIMDSIKHVTPNMNSIRCLYPGIEFILPPKSDKLIPFEYTLEDLDHFIVDNEIKLNENFLSKIFMGVSSQLSKSICHSLKEKGIDINYDNIHKINEYIKEVFNKAKELNFSFNIYKSENITKDFYCIELNNMCQYEKINFSSASELLDKYYYEKDKEDRLKSKSSSLTKLVNNNIDRCIKKIQLLKDSLSQCEQKDQFKIFGELLTANIYSIKPGDHFISVLNYYDENSSYIDIKLDPNKSASDNIQKYFKKYNKLKKSESAAKIQIDSTNEELDYLQSVLTSIQNVEDYKGIEDIKRELMETGYLKFKKANKQKDKKSKPLHFISSEGIDIYVGKNNIQNDYLTLKFANKNDLWLHTKEVPGSHVIVKTIDKFTDKTLEEAALLAAYYSKGRESSKVAVDYTEVRNVHKPNGAKPGMVIYYTNKTLYIDPIKPDLEKIE